jgi:hypothetical protein
MTMLPAATTGTSIGRPRSHSTICTAGARIAAPPSSASRQPGRAAAAEEEPVAATLVMDGCSAAAAHSRGNAMKPASIGPPGTYGPLIVTTPKVVSAARRMTTDSASSQ